MRIVELGEGTPEVAVVGAIHGDEPCGARAVERLAAEAPAVDRPVKLVLANEEALERGVRYVDADLNRSFPGDAEAASHEGRLAHDLGRELRGCTTLALHSTQSCADPFAIVDTADEISRALCPRLPVAALVETDLHTDGRLIEHPHTIEVECGLQGSDAAAENAYRIVRGFLSTTNALPKADAETSADADTDADANDGDGEASTDEETPVFRLLEPIPKPQGRDYEVFVDNFEHVAAGEAFAGVDGEELTADESFYPVLLSAEGYEDIFGYAAERVGVVEGAYDPRPAE